MKILFFNINAITLLITFNIYSLMLNHTNHSGFNFCWLILVFSALLITGFLLDQFTKMKFMLLIMMIICISGILNIILFEKMNIMMLYDIWIKKGMPQKFDF